MSIRYAFIVSGDSFFSHAAASKCCSIKGLRVSILYPPCNACLYIMMGCFSKVYVSSLPPSSNLFREHIVKCTLWDISKQSHVSLWCNMDNAWSQSSGTMNGIRHCHAIYIPKPVLHLVGLSHQVRDVQLHSWSSAAWPARPFPILDRMPVIFLPALHAPGLTSEPRYVF